MSSVARYSETVDEGERVLRFQGDLTLSRLGVLPTRLERLKGRGYVLDLSGVGRMDTIGAWIIHRTARDRDARITGLQEDNESLLRQVEQADQPVKVRPDKPSSFNQLLDQVGTATVMAGQTMVGLLGFFGALLITCGRIIRSPRRFRVNAVVQRFEVVGI